MAGLSGGDRLKTRLGEMLVEGQRLPQPALLHDDERNAVGEGVTLVGMAAEIGPAGVKKIAIDVNERFGIGHQAIADDQRPAMMAARV